MNTPAPRKRGAQANNTNAVKHGFYANSFTDLEARDLQAVTTLDLTDEISMLRVSLRRVFGVIGETEDADEARQALAVLGQSATRLAGLLKVQRLLQGSGSVDVAAALNQALGDVIKEFGCGN